MPEFGDYGELKMISGGAGQGARSMATIGSPDAYDGFDIYGVAFTPQYQHRDCTIGLSHGSSTNDIADIDYGIRFHSHYFYVVEKGHQRYWNAQHINAGVDVFEVCKRRFRWVVKALREKELCRTRVPCAIPSAPLPSLPLPRLHFTPHLRALSAHCFSRPVCRLLPPSARSV
jgi:hypothetical protein